MKKSVYERSLTRTKSEFRNLVKSGRKLIGEQASQSEALRAVGHPIGD